MKPSVPFPGDAEWGVRLPWGEAPTVAPPSLPPAAAADTLMHEAMAGAGEAVRGASPTGQSSSGAWEREPRVAATNARASAAPASADIPDDVSAAGKKWGTGEDARLRDAVDVFGTADWKRVAAAVGNGRTTKSVRARWAKLHSTEPVEVSDACGARRTGLSGASFGGGLGGLASTPALPPPWRRSS